MVEKDKESEVAPAEPPNRIFSPPPIAKTDWTQLIFKLAAVFLIAVADKYNETGGSATIIAMAIFGLKACGLFYFGFGSYGKLPQRRYNRRS